MIQVVAVLLIALGASGFFLYKQIRANGELRTQITTIEQERDDAKAEAKALTRATRDHARELAAARRKASDASRVVAAIPSDDCLDRRLPDAALDVLRMHSENGKAKPPASSGRKVDAAIRGRNDSRSARGLHPDARSADGVRSR